SSVRKILLDRLSAAGVTIVAGAEVVEVRAGSVIVVQQEEAREFAGFDALVMATGLRANDGLAEELEGRVSELHVIGDAREPRTALNAVHEGAQAALRV
ncbi:MAG: FAD-dependent oxidoreductase, partial [Armatimonadota bacterium]